MIVTHLLHQREMVIIRRHSQHNPMLNVKQDFLFLAIITNERVKSIAVRDPTYEPRVCGQQESQSNVGYSSGVSTWSDPCPAAC